MREGFSLVELSIVLVILGLITGSVVAGQSLIRAAELRSVSTDYERFITAGTIFRQKYSAIPGDFANATATWGTAAAGVACKTTNSGNVATCDGDDNGIIWPTATSNEFMRFWQHLVNAGLIEGNYTGISNTGDLEVTLLNSPGSKIKNGTWAAIYWGVSVAGDGWSFWANTIYNNLFQFGCTVAGSENVCGTMNPAETFNIDKKIDDGKPATGKLVVRNWPGCTLAANQSDKAADYRFNEPGNVCILIFKDILNRDKAL